MSGRTTLAVISHMTVVVDSPVTRIKDAEIT